MRSELAGTMTIVTSALSLARELWRYGEPELAERARRLSPTEVLDIGNRAGDLVTSGEWRSLWPGGPSASPLLLAAVERLEGSVRPMRRSRRLPEKQLPPHLQATEAERWEAVKPVAGVMDAAHLQGRRSPQSSRSLMQRVGYVLRDRRRRGG